MAIRTDFAAGEVLAAADLNDTFGAKSNLASPTFTGTPAAPTAAVATNTTQIATTAFVLANAGGKILQVVRATDTTQRTTTSTSFVDVTGMSVTITPQKNTSAILLVASFLPQCPTGSGVRMQITDSSNNAISGSSESNLSLDTGAGATSVTIIGYATPATTSATTYKLRFKSNNGISASCLNNVHTGQMYAIEVSA